MAKADARRIAIVGAGPVGLEAALYARKLGYAVTVYERGNVGEHLKHWGHIRLFSPFGMNVTPLGRAALAGTKLPADTDGLTGAEHVAAYLEPLSKCELLKDAIQSQTNVLQIGRAGHLKSDPTNDPKRAAAPFRLLVVQNKMERSDEADVVLDCTGTYARHRWLGDGGIPALGERGAEAQIAYWLEDVLGAKRQHYAGKSVLVVGSGYSAATTVVALSALAEQHQDMWVTWLARGPRKQPMPRVPNDPLKERDRLAVKANNLAARGDGNVEYHANSVVQLVEFRGQDKGFRVLARVAGQVKELEFDRVIAQVGYTPDPMFFRELQVHECYASLGPMALAAALSKQTGGDCLTLAGCGPASLKTPEPNFYVLGSKSYGRNPHFLLRTGFEQVRDAFALIAGKPDLDLYKSK